jgi:hypothetical protein
VERVTGTSSDVESGLFKIVLIRSAVTGGCWNRLSRSPARLGYSVSHRPRTRRVGHEARNGNIHLIQRSTCTGTSGQPSYGGA